MVYIHDTPTNRLLNMRLLAAKPPVEDTASGNPLTFLTDLARPLKSLSVPFTPVQSSGTPSPDNVLPITGWNGVTVWHTGKNLIDDTKVYQSGSTTVYIGATDSGRNIFLKAGKYTVTRDFNGETIGLYYIKRDAVSEKTIFNTSTTDTTKTITVAEDGYYAFFAYRGSASGGASASDIKSVIVECGETATAYAPYTGQSYPVDWTTEAGTVYGGTLDVVSGVLTVEWASFTAKWGDFDLRDSNESFERKTISYNGIFVSEANNGKAICNVGKKYWRNDLDSSHFYISPSVIQMVLPVGTSTDLDIMVVAELVQPQTVQLTPEQITALVGDNTIWSDTNGDCEVTFLKKG